MVRLGEEHAIIDGIDDQAGQYGEPENQSFGKLAGVAPPCDECGKRERCPDGNPKLCDECDTAE